MRIPLQATYSYWSRPGQCNDSVRERDDALSQAWRQAVDSEIVAAATRSHRFGGVGPLELEPESVSRDLCRYLRGVTPAMSDAGTPIDDEFEPLEARAVFRLDDRALSETLIDGAITGVCPEFAARRDELVGLLGDG